MNNIIAFTVFATPQQRGSKQAVLIPKRGGGWVEKDGRPIVAAKDDNPKSKDWMRLVSQVAGEAMIGRSLIADPVRLEVTFHFNRPQSHFGSGRNASVVKASAPAFPLVKDLDKLVRAVGDGLTKVVYVDDKQVVELYARKLWTEESERAEISVGSVSRFITSSEPKKEFALC